MKFYSSLWLFLLCVNFLSAQDMVFFTYDNAGNQIRRYLVEQFTEISENSEQIIEEEENTNSNPASFLSYYPNPVKEELTIIWETQADNYAVMAVVYNSTGQLIHEKNIGKHETQLSLNLAGYASGIYIVSLHYFNNEKQQLKIIKE